MSTQQIRLDHLYADLDSSMGRLRQQHKPVTASRKIVEQALEDGEAHYGINTGFGVLVVGGVFNYSVGVFARSVKAAISIEGLKIKSGKVFQIAVPPIREVYPDNADEFKPSVKPLPRDRTWTFPPASVSAIQLSI